MSELFFVMIDSDGDHRDVIVNMSKTGPLVNHLPLYTWFQFVTSVTPKTGHELPITECGVSQ